MAIGGLLAFGAYVWLLTKATPVVVTAFSFASDDKPELYAAFLALLVGLPGLLWTLPRAFRRSPPSSNGSEGETSARPKLRRPPRLFPA